MIHRLILLLACVAGPLPAAEFFVSPGGSDTASGTREKPWATLSRAQAKVAEFREKNPTEAVTVWLGAGDYLQRDGVVFGDTDSGTTTAPVVYRGAEGGATRIMAGVPVPASAIKPVEDPALLARIRPEARGKISQIDLGELDLEVESYPNVFRKIENLEVFYKGARLPLSRWPNGKAFATMKEVIESGVNPARGGTFRYREEDPGRWRQALEDGGVWLRGFWRVPWVIEAIKVEKIDADARTITFASPNGGGIGSKYARDKNGFGKGDGKEPWHALNLMEEIDQPGEWSVQFKTRTLYLWLPDRPQDGDLRLADRNVPLMSFVDASHITLRELALEGSLGHGVSIVGGEGIRLLGCRISRVGNDGVFIQGGKHHEVRSCDITEAGQAGIRLTGGKRETLEPGGHQIINNVVSGIGLYFPAPGIVVGEGVKSETVGHRIAHNRIHDVPNAGIVFAGNDNLLELNEIYRCGIGSGDLGAFYTNSGWTARGNIIRHNFVHHSMNANSFYMDDGSCGALIEGNIAYQTASGGFLGGGHDQTLRHNIIIACTIALHVDDRGVSRNYTATDKRLRGDLDSVPYQSPPWSTRYPELLTLLQNKPEYPSGIRLESNLLVSNGTARRFFKSIAQSRGFVDQNNMETTSDSLFVNPKEFDFRIRDEAQLPEALAALRRIPFQRIGLELDEYRRVIPPRDMKLLREGITERHFDSLQDIETTNRQQP